jgi:hypothetical protein
MYSCSSSSSSSSSVRGRLVLALRFTDVENSEMPIGI